MSDLLTWIALRRVHSGSVAKCGGCWIDGGRPVPNYLPAVLDELTGGGLIVLADVNQHVRRASLTETGQTRYAALLERHGTRDVRSELEVPAPVHSPAPRNGRSAPATGPALRWARDPHDGRMHALQSVDVLLAESRGFAECLCEYRLPADVALENGPSGALCLRCVVGAVADIPGPAS